MMILLTALAGAVVLGLGQIAAARKSMTLQQRPIPVKVKEDRTRNEP